MCSIFVHCVIQYSTCKVYKGPDYGTINAVYTMQIKITSEEYNECKRHNEAG